MRQSRVIIWLAVAAGFGLLLAVSALAVGRPVSSLAAPLRGNEAPLPILLPHSSTITCTLSTTTTDALPNINSFSDAAILAHYTGLALVEGDIGEGINPEEDYFRLDNAVVDWRYQVEASPDLFGGNYNLGIVVYDASYTPILTDVNQFDGNAAYVSLVATTTGSYYFKVFQISDQCSGGTYTLDVSAATPTPTPGPTHTPLPGPSSTPLPGPTPIPGADRFEPNYDFDHAKTIATGVAYSDLNFIPWLDGTEDNDYYKIWVKPGLLFTCETFDLAPGLDTNMIFYDNNRNSLNLGNDDVELGDYSSHVSYYSNYEGFLYVLVGHGGRFPLEDVKQSSYGLLCTMSVPGIPTATPRPTATSQPAATATSSSPLPTPTPSGELAVRSLATPAPPSSSDTAALHFVPVDLLIYYDANDDRSPGAGEGIAGILALAFDTTTGEQVAEGFTDSLGHLQFTTAAQGTVRLSIPYLGISYLVGSEGASVYVRVAPQPLPNAIP